MTPININTLSELIYLEANGFDPMCIFQDKMSCLHIEWYSIDMNIRTVEILDELDNIHGFHHYFGPNLGPKNKKWTGLDTVKLDWTLTPKEEPNGPNPKEIPNQQFRRFGRV